MKLNNEQIRLLAQAERMMDEGTLPFVIYRDDRMPVAPDIMEELGLEQGQTVNSVIKHAILLASLAATQAELALKKAAGRC
ncbi:MAG: hypothetical protein AAF674_16815 [Pseudomonadota bacterium]